MAQDVDFAREVLPILSDKCFACHGPDAEGDRVRLDSLEGAMRDLGGYRAIDPAKPDDSELLLRIHDADDPMPPSDAEKQLTDAERDLLSRWVKQGGAYARHWAFVTPTKRGRKAAAPEPIDAYVAHKLAERDIQPAPEAAPHVLARRLALTLTGLPPEPDALERFLQDPSDRGYAALVEELLASPRFGEHQARYWLDAVRYGDTHGLHLDNKRGIYPYRDWVVRAFNQNLPLDKFIEWQLAGDMLPEPTLDQQIATGYVRMNPSTSEGGAIPAEFQCKNNFDRTETFGTVMLGMTLTCARCHTHKYDPITQTEYYRLLAFFNSTAESPMDGNRYDYAPAIRTPRDQSSWRAWTALEKQGRRFLQDVGAGDAVKAHADACNALTFGDWKMSGVVAHDATAPESMEAVKGLPGVLRKVKPNAEQAVWIECTIDARAAQLATFRFSGGPRSKVWFDGEPVAHEGGRVELHLRPGGHGLRVQFVGKGAPVDVGIDNPWRALAGDRAWTDCSVAERLALCADPYAPLAVDHRRARQLSQRVAAARASFVTTLVARDLPKPRETRVLMRGEYDLPSGDALGPDVPAVMGGLAPELPRNRLGLARWLTSREHPLTSRVFVNRLWLRTFGEGLVRTPEDFGVQGRQPTHPELLDWLAVELQDSGWDLKHMLRLMVTSRTFRQSSAQRADVDDPKNELLARGPSYRLDAEVIRDIALWASGLLDPRMGGEGVKPYQPSGMWAALAHPASNTKRYVKDSGDRLYRRSLYVYWKRTSPHPMMTLFDAPSREASCVMRSRTSTPLQSLALLNETQRLEMARVLAQRLLRERSDDRARLDMLFGMLASRPPTVREQKACLGLLGAMRDRYAADAEGAEAVLKASGEAQRDADLSPVELAAWMQVALPVLASDPAITLN